MSPDLRAAIVQDAATSDVLMLAWMDDEALRLTRETGEAHFFSRSRQQLWRKGETSGNTLAVDLIDGRTHEKFVKDPIELQKVTAAGLGLRTKPKGSALLAADSAPVAVVGCVVGSIDVVILGLRVAEVRRDP